MPTTLYLRSTSTAVGTNSLLLSTTPGASTTTTAVVATTAGGTNIQWTNTSGGSALEWVTLPFSSDITVSGTISVSLQAMEDNMSANIGARAYIFKRSQEGTYTQIGTGDDGVEFGTSNTQMDWTLTPTSTDFVKGDRLVVRMYITNVGTMNTGYLGTMYYEGAAASAFDSYISTTETLTFGADSDKYVSITGVEETNEVGSVTRTQSGNQTLSTVSSIGNVGSVARRQDGSQSITSVSTTANIGSVLRSISGGSILSTVFTTGNVGSVTTSQAVIKNLTTVFSTGNVGSVARSQSGNRTLSSVSSTGNVGSVRPGKLVTLSSTTATGSVGTVGALSFGKVDLTGVSATASVGSLKIWVPSALFYWTTKFVPYLTTFTRTPTFSSTDHLSVFESPDKYQLLEQDRDILFFSTKPNHYNNTGG